MITYTEHLIKEAAKNAFASAGISEANFVIVVDMGMNDFAVIDYDNNFDALIPTVADIYDPVYIVDRNLIVTEFS